MSSRQITRFADDDTLAHIAKLERENARLLAGLRLIADGMASDHFREWAQGVARAALKDANG